MRPRLVLSMIGSAALGCTSQRAPPAPSAPVPSSAVVSPSPLARPSSGSGLPAPRTAEECRACRGAWGAHGIADTESCNCRTSDRGKRCTDGADCEGICFADPELLQQETADAGGPGRGWFVGQCSEFVTVFGCHRIIDRGARAKGPMPLADPPQTICVD